MFPKDRHFYLFLIAYGTILLLSSCQLTKSSKPDNTYSYRILKHSVIKVDTTQAMGRGGAVAAIHFTIKPGGNSVFKYQHWSNAADSDTRSQPLETLVFQLPPDTKKFDYQDGKLKQARVYYRRSCACKENDRAFKVTNGEIKGEKLSSVSWIVKANVMGKSKTDTFHVKFDEPFYSKELF